MEKGTPWTFIVSLLHQEYLLILQMWAAMTRCLIKKKRYPSFVFLFSIKLLSLLSGNWKIFPMRILEFICSYFNATVSLGTHTATPKLFQQYFYWCWPLPCTDVRCARNIPLKKKKALGTVQTSLFTSPLVYTISNVTKTNEIGVWMLSF
jgi:hypothetical protein